MKILVVGGTGLVGQYLVKRLLDLGYEVHVLTRDANKALTGTSSFVSIVADIGSEDWIEKSGLDLGSYHVIYHLAYAITEDESYNRRVTVGSVEKILCNLDRLGKVALQHFVYAGSMTVFGLAPKDDIVTEDSEKKPDSVYASNKLEVTQLFLNKEGGFLITVLHLTGVYDAASNRIRLYQNMLKDNYLVTLKGGLGKNNIVHADDAASAFVDCLKRKKTNRFEEYVINGESVIYKDWFKVIEKTTDVEEKRLARKYLSHFIGG